MQHNLLLGRGNFCAEKQHSNKFLPFGARGSYASLCICAVKEVWTWCWDGVDGVFDEAKYGT